jgi:hypothetical protein
MSLTSRLSLRYLLLLVLLFRLPMIMLIDLKTCLWWGRQVALLATIFRLAVVTSPIVTAIVVLASMSVVAVVVVVAA